MRFSDSARYTRTWLPYLAAATVVLVASPAAAAASVSIDTPTADAVVLESANISVAVASPNLMASVVANIGNASAVLAPSGGSGVGNWTGTIDFSSLPSGAATLSVIATDVLGDSGTATRKVTRSRPPAVVIKTARRQRHARVPPSQGHMPKHRGSAV